MNLSMNLNENETERYEILESSEQNGLPRVKSFENVQEIQNFLSKKYEIEKLERGTWWNGSDKMTYVNKMTKIDHQIESKIDIYIYICEKNDFFGKMSYVNFQLDEFQQHEKSKTMYQCLYTSDSVKMQFLLDGKKSKNIESNQEMNQPKQTLSMNFYTLLMEKELLKQIKMDFMHLVRYIEMEMQENPLLEWNYFTEEKNRLLTWANKMQRITNIEQEITIKTRAKRHNKILKTDLYMKMNQKKHTLTLERYLQYQIEFFRMKGKKRHIFQTFIKNLDENGYLQTDLLYLIQEYFCLSNQEMEQHIQLFQQLEAGVGARSLQECIYLQLKAKQELQATKESKLALAVVGGYWNEFKSGNWEFLKKELRMSEEDLKKVCLAVKNCEPAPAKKFVSLYNATYTMPEVGVKEENGKIHVYLEERLSDYIDIETVYDSVIYMPMNQTDKSFLKKNIKKADILLKCMKKREMMLLKIATYVIELQKDFILNPFGMVKPLFWEDICSIFRIEQDYLEVLLRGKSFICAKGTFLFSDFVMENLIVTTEA